MYLKTGINHQIADDAKLDKALKNIRVHSCYSWLTAVLTGLL